MKYKQWKQQYAGSCSVQDSVMETSIFNETEPRKILGSNKAHYHLKEKGIWQLALNVIHALLQDSFQETEPSLKHQS